MRQALVVLSVLLLAGAVPAAGVVRGQARPVTDEGQRFMWCPGASEGEADYYAAFRGSFELDSAAEVELRTLGASWYVVWLDGEYLSEGPARFPKERPEYQAERVRLAAGKHVVAVQAHHEGLSTRILDNVPPFLYCALLVGGREAPVRWKCARLGGYASQVKRVNPQLGWIEWCDTRQIPAGWRSKDFDDSSWADPVTLDRGLGKLRPLCIANVRSFIHRPKPVAKGFLAETFGYEMDNIAARFFLRDLMTERPGGAQGVWRRYDLGRVRLMRPRFVLDLPSGAVVEFAYSEYLVHGRVSPWITLSGGDSCNFDHYVARGGEQEFFPLTPRGGRFLEIHVLAEPAKVRFVREEVVERCYYGPPDGSLRSGDELLDRIWLTGIETHRACAEDALTDNPTRERGQWAGDVVGVGMEIAAVGYSDLRLCRRALAQCAECAREDGLVSGLCPGGGAYLTTYAAQWLSACMHYFELTGDRSLLEELFPAAERNIAAFERFMTAGGLSDDVGWGFVDWGYVPNPGPSDIAVDLHYLAGLRDMVRWCEAIGKTERADYYRGLEARLTGIVGRWFDEQTRQGKDVWPRIGYHRAVLGLSLGFIESKAEKECVEFIRKHMLECFPNDPAAPRLSDPSAASSRLITPYFAHYAMPVLIERREMDFVLDQYRKCWGWALGGGRTTWLEVFDTRWSHCHQWSGCPTWQLSRYVLGLTPRYDLGPGHYVLSLHPGSLPRAEGALPLPDGKGAIRVSWERRADGIHWTLETPVRIYLHIRPMRADAKEEVVEIGKDLRRVFPAGQLQ